MNLIGIQCDELRDWWPYAWPLLRPAVEMIDQHDEAAVLKALEKRDFQLWLVVGDSVKAAVITEVGIWPCTKECTVRYCGGVDVDEWVHLLAIIEDWAREQGCDRIYASGRKGWVRKLQGYEEQAVILVKDLCHA